MIKVVKKDGTKEDFNVQKIVVAVNKSAYRALIKFTQEELDKEIIIDNEKNRHVVSNICPHMKCNLIFNYIDKTWDCPCHASKFDIDGNVVYGPSVYNIGINVDKN